MLDLATKYYYKAVVFHYLAEDPEKAVGAIYQSLRTDERHAGSLKLARHLRKGPSPGSRSASRESLLSFIESENMDAFLIGFLSEISPSLLSRIDWEPLVLHLDGSRQPTDQVWKFLLRENWADAFSVWHEKLKDIQGNIVSYFQIAYLYYVTRNFLQAEPYLVLLAHFGGMYRLAALRLLLQLPRHHFKTLLDFPEILKNGSFLEQLEMAKIVHHSWDENSFQKIVSHLQKKANGELEYLALAGIDLDRGDFKKAAKNLEQAFEGNPKNIAPILQLLSTSFIARQKPVFSFVKRMLKRIDSREAMLLAARHFHRISPQASLIAYEWLCKSKKEDPGNIALGQAIAFYHLNEFEKADILLKRTMGQCPSLYIEISAWQAKLHHKQGETRKAFQQLEDILEKFPGHPSLVEAFKEMERGSCPNCFAAKENSVCGECGYHSPHIFEWQNGKLRWNAQTLSFPISFVLLTTISKIYPVDRPVEIVVFSPMSQTGELVFHGQGKIFSNRTIECEAGITVITEKNIPEGIYEIEFRGKGISSNKHSLGVGNLQKEMKMDLRSVHRKGHEWQLLAQLEDSLGFPLMGLVEIEIYSLSSSFRLFIHDYVQDGLLKITFPCEESLSLAMDIVCQGKKVSLLLPSLAPRSWEEIAQALGAPQRKKWQGLPLSIESKEGRLAVQALRDYQEIGISLQPLGNFPLQAFRFEKVPEGKIVSLPIPCPLTGFYLGTTRFHPGRFFQNVGVECTGISCFCPDILSLELPDRVLPEETFQALLQSKRPVKGWVFFCNSNHVYHPLSVHLLDFLLPLVTPSVEKKSGRQMEIAHLASFSFCEAKPFEMEERQVFSFKAPQTKGRYSVVCIASDGRSFFERMESIEVQPHYEISPRFPSCIGEKDRVEGTVDYFSETERWLRISSLEKGTLYQNKVQGRGHIDIEVSSPGTFEITMDRLEERCEVVPLEQEKVRKSSVYRLSEGQSGKSEGQSGESWVFAHPSEVAGYIAKNLLKQDYQGTETLSAQLFCAALLYRSHSLEKRNEETEYWEKEIQRLSGPFCDLASEFPSGRWGHWKKEPPEKKIMEEVLHHLSPFLEMPKFDRLEHIAQKTMKAALDWEIKSNRLFPLASAFAERRFSAPESAAYALKYNLDRARAMVYLEKKCVSGIPKFTQCLGGEEEAVAFICQAYQSQRNPLAEEILFRYFKERFIRGTLSTPSATVAFFEFLMQESPAKEPIIETKGNRLKIDRAQALDSPFTVVQGNVWCVSYRDLQHNWLASRKIVSMNPLGAEKSKSISVGQEFPVRIKLKKISYPYVRLMLPANLVLLDGKKVITGNVYWPYPQREIEVTGKAIRKGKTTLYCLPESRYGGYLPSVAYAFPVVVQ